MHNSTANVSRVAFYLKAYCTGFFKPSEFTLMSVVDRIVHIQQNNSVAMLSCGIIAWKQIEANFGHL